MTTNGSKRMQRVCVRACYFSQCAYTTTVEHTLPHEKMYVRPVSQYHHYHTHITIYTQHLLPKKKRFVCFPYFFFRKRSITHLLVAHQYGHLLLLLLRTLLPLVPQVVHHPPLSSCRRLLGFPCHLSKPSETLCPANTFYLQT